MATLRATCLGFNRLPTPLDPQGIKNYYAILDADTLFDLANWRDINVRDAKEFGRIPEKIRESLLQRETFFLINRGLTLSAKAVRYDNSNNTIEIDVEDPAIHGLMDGGHTYLQIKNFKEDKEERQVERQYVKAEIITGLDRAEIVNLVDARNTSNQVKQVSLENLKDSFRDLKAILDGQSYGNLISYSEYETMLDASGNEVGKPLSIADILKCLVCLDIANFDDTTHPFEAATRDNKTITHFTEHESDMKPLYPLLPAILRLWDTIGRDFVPSYNASGGRAGLIGETGDRFFKKIQKPKNLYFLASTYKYSFPDSLRLPILSGFRAAITKVKNGRYAWKYGIDPSRFFTDVVGQRVTRPVCKTLIETQDPTRTSRSESVWENCYTQVAYALLTMDQRGGSGEKEEHVLSKR